MIAYAYAYAEAILTISIVLLFSTKNKSLIAGSVKVGGLWKWVLWLMAKQVGRLAGRAAEPLRPHPCKGLLFEVEK